MTSVFVVDDDPVICRLAKHILERAGYAVTVLYDGEEAWKALKNSVPDILLTDLMMPRITGVELLQRIRADTRLSALPVVVFTARSEPHDRRRAEEAGASHYLTKPFSSAQLLEVVGRFALPDAGG